jgi:hypothetical protein
MPKVVGHVKEPTTVEVFDRERLQSARLQAPDR